MTNVSNLFTEKPFASLKVPQGYGKLPSSLHVLLRETSLKPLPNLKYIFETFSQDTMHIDSRTPSEASEACLFFDC